MKTSRMVAAALLIASSLALPLAQAEQPDIKRTDLQRHDLGVPGREVVQVRVDIAPGVLAPNHSHPGEEIVYVIEGLLEYRLEGEEPLTLKAGEVLFIPAGKIHSARNVGSVNAAELATYIVEKGKPLATPGPASDPVRKADIGFLEIDKDITLRRMVVHNPAPEGTVLLLHGFPETLYAWKDISLILGDEYEVHAIDWPGYGLSSRPTVDKFSYAPTDYAHVLKEYIRKAGIDTSRLTIYATDIGGLPALLLALEEPDIAKAIIVGDFAPFNRPRYIYDSLQSLKSPRTSEQARVALNRNRDEILENTFTRGLPQEAQFEISREFKDDMSQAWDQGAMTSADAFHHYYSHFTRDQEYFEVNLSRLRTPVKVVWGEKDLYIKKEMGVEFAERVSAQLTLLAGIGHYPHLQTPKQVIDEIRASFR